MVSVRLVSKCICVNVNAAVTFSVHLNAHYKPFPLDCDPQTSCSLHLGMWCSADRALARIANAYVKKDELKEALLFYNKSLAEHRDPEIVKKTQQVWQYTVTSSLPHFILR